MDKINQKFSLEVTSTESTCPIGEKVGNQNLIEKKIPVLSCDGACIRGEIARIAANIVAKNETYRRGCHGELFTVPHSAISNWITKSEKIVLIDGCFLRCHGRILENLVEKEKLIQFDALSHYNRYTHLFDIDMISEAELNQVAQNVANWVLASLDKKG